MNKLLSDNMINGEMSKTMVDKGSIRTIKMRMSPADVRDHYERLREIGELFTKEDIIKALSTIAEEDVVRSVLSSFSNKRRLLVHLSTMDR